MILLVDIGNSRVKWARFDGVNLGQQQAADYRNWSAKDWRARLFGEGSVTRVVAANVAGAATSQALREAASVDAACTVEFVTVTATAAGVTNGYANPLLLGVDRWLAVIAAHHRTHRACCVVDVGTAATVDGVTADGRHLGGFIVPGPQLMVSALLKSTSNLERHAAESVSRDATVFADNTRDAIERGCLVALAALADRSLALLGERTGSTPLLLFTGGAAPLVAPYVVAPLELVPDLVLQGLAVLARAGR